jgi:hypothetical protein
MISSVRVILFHSPGERQVEARLSISCRVTVAVMSDLSWLFASTVAGSHATLTTKRALPLTWAGLAPAGSHQLAAGALTRSPRRRASSVGGTLRPSAQP